MFNKYLILILKLSTVLFTILEFSQKRAIEALQGRRGGKRLHHSVTNLFRILHTVEIFRIVQGLYGKYDANILLTFFLDTV